MAFVEIETITIHSGTDDYYESSYLDGNYLYIAEVGWPVIVHKIDLTTNTEVAELEFDRDVIYYATYQTVVADDDYIYWGCTPATGKAAIVKIDKSSFEVSAILNLNSAEYFDVLARAVYDSINKVSYWVCWDLIHKVDMTSFTKVSTLDCGVNYQSISAIQIDATSDYLYIANNVSGSRIGKIQISSFSIVDYISTSGYGGMGAMCIDTVDNKLYPITQASISTILKINLATFALETTIQLPANEYYFNFALCDSSCRYAYFTNYYRIVRVNLQTFERVDSIELSSDVHENIMINSSHHIYLAMLNDNMSYTHIDASCVPISSILLLDEEPIVLAGGVVL